MSKVIILRNYKLPLTRQLREEITYQIQSLKSQMFRHIEGRNSKNMNHQHLSYLERKADELQQVLNMSREVERKQAA